MPRSYVRGNRSFHIVYQDERRLLDAPHLGRRKVEDKPSLAFRCHRPTVSLSRAEMRVNK